MWKLDSLGKELMDSTADTFIIFQMRPNGLSWSIVLNLIGQYYNLLPCDLYIHLPHKETTGNSLGLFGYFFLVVRPPSLALGGVQLPLPVMQWSERTERT